MMHTMYLCPLADGTRVQAQSSLESVILLDEDDTNDGNPDQSNDRKPTDEVSQVI